jgi:hypothetical protein
MLNPNVGDGSEASTIIAQKRGFRVISSIKNSFLYQPDVKISEFLYTFVSKLMKNYMRFHKKG